MSDEELANIEARAAAATPGPWTGECGSVTDLKPEEWAYSMEWIDNRRASKEQRDADARFIAAARQDVPGLVAEVRRLRAEVRQWRAERRDVL